MLMVAQVSTLGKTTNFLQKKTIQKYMIDLKCPKSGAEMQEGFILEHRLSVRWIAGKPEKSFLGDIKAAGEHRHIESYRCVGCGYLELYATEIIA